MHLAATADQRLFQETTRDFLADTVPLATVRALAENRAGLDRQWWRRGAQLGWTAPLVAESHGGGSVSGRPLTELAGIAEEFGRACAPGPLAATSAVLTGLAGADDRCATEIDAIVAGDAVATWAVYEPGRGLDLASPGCLAVPDGAGYRLTGIKDRVEYGADADLFLVTAHSPDGPVQVLVSASAPGVRATPTWTLDLVRTTAHVEFRDVAVEPAVVLQRGPAAAAAARAQLQVAATLTAVELVGATDRAFDATVGWMFDRYTFGRPLASYQALKHRMADNKTWLEACRATAWAAAAAWDDDAESAPECAAVAKAYVGDRAPVIVQDCVQLHGGIGVTWEHDLHLYLRRVTLGRALYGTPEEQYRRITEFLEQTAA
ncbi:acyl-CoA dehydrogenase family protein [Nocardia goodfellowii]|uniref:Alkylation response protein AidB-like acyl-CoA dehydrogenase n=1 Tax=Nocardia goodfellowii TaxID=882446 RepID=A0ABS4QLL5_9NOCA|nr:acyl-CoA dehydrogenase family protein [Nocardia goodfellowii]MBP2191993.1 alkylation response protein AidB-like acyl-CoA dehydrogenase [Nocardia goodfellowii]